ncbi:MULTISPECIES: GerAB/ArcD/ProY family transporter [Pontibacillus]|uniref:GerAB/ArcD/ProY family transporter n=1 Tax=Pontibacillus chungwhensis TaxID=265426 RepID=A0ABY8V0L7_9BACI|nr:MULTISPECIES: GerAB/ArcD/ProY family transporter [Pontibacillus]MCD5322188.1 spore germination protein [Pontibacillus sp. HN14]WIF99482.1 GerAB/ArcD/ProY family transporter [Pontibacillus chungwhensis]
MSNVSQNQQISPFLVFFLIHSMQIGVGVLSFERVISEKAGHDAWMSIILAALFSHILLWMIYSVVTKHDQDIISIHQSLLGKWIGNVLSLALLSYFALIVLQVLRVYIDVIRAWIFPETPVWLLALLFLLLSYYFVLGDFRVVAGICFFGVLLPLPLLLLKIYPIQDGHVTNLIPFFEADAVSLLKASKEMTFSYVGIEFLLLYYPFIKRGKTSARYAHFGLLLTSFIYLFSALVTFMYFSQGQLQHVVWPTLDLWKTVDFPFIERFEYVGIAIWLLVILPQMALGLWCILRGVNQMITLHTRLIGYGIVLTLVVAASLIQGRDAVQMLNTTTNQTSFIVLACYIPCLFLLSKIRRRQGQ